MKLSRYFLVILVLAVVPIAGFVSRQAPEVPVGLIAMWSGDAGNLPDGWALCDGQHGTPDLRDKFVVSIGNDYGVGDTGGAAFIDLTHNHSLRIGDGLAVTGTGMQKMTTDALGETDIRPPFYALCFIMYVGDSLPDSKGYLPVILNAR